MTRTSSVATGRPEQDVNHRTAFANEGLFTKEFAAAVEKFWARRSRILILVDGVIRVLPDSAPRIGQEFVDPSSAFGISAAIATVKNFSSGFSSFVVTVATRNGTGAPILGFDITGFRFSDAALVSFDQVWLFGYNPGNVRANSLDPADDALIERGLNPYDEPVNALSDEELAALARWMDRGGGVFAAGDHHLLGASMCHKVPRVSTMRRWTIADGVSTRDGTTRFDTERPATPAQVAGTASIGVLEAEEKDPVPQRTEWVRYSSPAPLVTRPHPLLCHPTLGPINILPDHMHEGLCYDFNAYSWQSEKRDLSFTFSGYANQHYPTVGGKRPLPEVVSWGTTLAAPPLRFASGDQPYRRFPQIAVYDGQAIGIGRVVVDSTWHHWFDMNLEGLERRARETGDRRDIDRILRYFSNVGIYLASPEWRAGQTLGWLKDVQLSYFGQEQIDLSAPTIDLGRTTSPHLGAELDACWVTEFVLDQIRQVEGRVWLWLKDKIEKPHPGGCRAPFELFESAVLGEVVRAAYSDMGDLRSQLAKDGRISRSSLFDDLYSFLAKATLRGLKAAIDFHAKDLQDGVEELARLERDQRSDSPSDERSRAPHASR